jgi:hypothetical protein
MRVRQNNVADLFFLRAEAAVAKLPASIARSRQRRNTKDAGAAKPFRFR